jgi:FdhD protein
MSEPFARVAVVQVRNGRRVEATDAAAAEVPLELRLQGRPFAVIMRTPGADRQLAAGFLLAERIIRGAGDLATIEHCVDPPTSSDDQRGNIVSVVLEDAAAERAAAALNARRDVMANSACGVCGRSTLDSMRIDLEPLDMRQRVSAAAIASLPLHLRSRQPLFDATGGLHAAGLFDCRGEALIVAEDVGRHNAVDKAIGTLLLRDELPASECVLCVSGRTSYEIVQKAWCAGVPIVASVSAPSSLAVTLAEEAGITLAGFVRDSDLNIYTHAVRIEQGS